MESTHLVSIRPFLFKFVDLGSTSTPGLGICEHLRRALTPSGRCPLDELVVVYINRRRDEFCGLRICACDEEHGGLH